MEEKAATKTKCQRFYTTVSKTGTDFYKTTHYRALPDTNPNGIPQDGANDYFLEVVYLNGTKLRIKGDLDLTRLRELVYLID